MSTELYYFTGTGNSLAVARDIARKTNGRLISIPAVMDRESMEIDADMLGIVSPAYYMRMPRIVEAFIGKLTGLQAKYIFAIVTVGGVAGGILERVSEAISLRGGNLAGGFVVRMPANYIHDASALPQFLQRRMFRTWEKRSDRGLNLHAQRNIAQLPASPIGGFPALPNPTYCSGLQPEYLRMANSAGRSRAIPTSTFRRPSRVSCTVIVVPSPHLTKYASSSVTPFRTPSRHFWVSRAR